MTGRWLRSKWVWALVLLTLSLLVSVVALVVFRDDVSYTLTGYRTTPMSVDRADRLFRRGLQPGQSREAVLAWLASQGVRDGRRSYQGRSIHYIVLERPDGSIGEVVWRAGLRHDNVSATDVSSIIRVVYPDAERDLLGPYEITVYLFFDKDGRLLRHWVDEFHFMP